MLGAELQLAGVDVVIVERRPDQELDGSRAGGLHPRTLEVLDQRGVVDRFVSEGRPFPFVGFAGLQLDVSDFPSRHNYSLGLWQRDIERILASWVLDELGVPIVRNRSVVAIAQDGDGVDVSLSDGAALRAAYLVGCDGGRSVVRKAAGIDFPGWDASISFMIAEVDMRDEPPVGMRPEGGGIGPIDPANPNGAYRVVLKEPRTDREGEPTIEDLRALLVDTLGSDFGVHNPTWISRFSDASRQADRYRAGRVFVAGDAAHIHGPHGGQGLNMGVQDAVNLGWKLGHALQGRGGDAVLDSYHDERHPVAARAVHNTMAQVALSNTDPRAHALREIVVDLLAMDEPRRRIAGMISALDIHYDLGDAHPLVGRRMPDLDLGAGRVYELLHDAAWVLLLVGGAHAPEHPALASSVRVIDASYDGAWELPVLGSVAAPGSVLIRPDGHVAWVGDTRDGSLRDVLNAWFA
jgi:3-(3-hydroxy-phenyl)propionate hydroxylase